MHSTRMRTARLLTVWGGGLPNPGVGVCIGGGGIPNPGGEVCMGGGGPVNRMAHRCKNITFPQTSFAGGKTDYFCEYFT